MFCKVFLSLLLLVAVASAQNITTTTIAPKNTTITIAPKNTTTPIAPKNTTTPVTPTNSTKAPTTTPLPTTTPMPDRNNNYTVKDGNVTCVMMKAIIDFKITYEKNVGGKKQNATVTVPLPNVFATDGSTCKGSNGSEVLSITFYKGWVLDFVFKKEASKANADSYNIDEMRLTYMFDENLPNATMKGSKTVRTSPGSNFVSTSQKGYYVCNAQSTFDIGGDQLLTKNFKYRAFNEKESINFDGSANECSADEDTNSIVPIAVGAALAGLVIIVLIAYLIGRKRTRKTGYESV